MAEKKFKIINLSHLSKISGINYQKIYNVLVSKIYNTLSDNERTKISNALYTEAKSVFKELGFNIEVTRIK